MALTKTDRKCTKRKPKPHLNKQLSVSTAYKCVHIIVHNFHIWHSTEQFSFLVFFDGVWRSQTLHDVWPFHYIYIFGGSCPGGILPGAKFTLCSPILAALRHGTPVAGVSLTLRHGTRNGITELSQRLPPAFGWAAITSGPHSSFVSVF